MNDEFYKVGDLVHYSGRVLKIVSKLGSCLFCQEYPLNDKAVRVFSVLNRLDKLVRIKDKDIAYVAVGEWVVWLGGEGGELDPGLIQGEKYKVLRKDHCFLVISERNTPDQEILASANLFARIVPYFVYGADPYWVGTMPKFLNKDDRISPYMLDEKEELKMDETIKMYNAKNLKEAKRQAEEEKANLEVLKAKQVYKSLINTKEMHEREIKIRQEEIKKLDAELAVFDKK